MTIERPMFPPRRKSAVSAIPKCGFDLVPSGSRPRRGRRASQKDYATLQFRPWRRPPDLRPTELRPSPEQMHNAGVDCRLAYGVMLRKRSDLIAMHANVDHAHVDKLMSQLMGTAEWLKSITNMVEMAYVRVLASAAAAHAKGIKFKGVEYPDEQVAS